MKYLIFILLLMAILITTGCVSENKNNFATLTLTMPVTPIPTNANAISTLALSEMALQPSDLPEGYKKETPEESGGTYAVQFVKGSTPIDKVTIYQTIRAYHVEIDDKNSDRLINIVTSEYFKNFTSTQLSNPNIGDKSVAYMFKDSTGESFTILFVKKDVFELMTAEGSQSDYEVLKTLAKKASDKIK
jgi:hypothetical protein